MQPLPIDALLPDLLASLARTPNLVLEAAPGAGKTTRVPPALLSLVPGEILVLEPRRIAARLAARRCAEELGEPLGQTIGYQVRFEDVTSPRTRLRFVTEGILTRRLLTDPDLTGVDAVLLDEFHERHLETDLALALLRRLQLRRPTLRLIIMSATLDAGPVAAFLEGPTLRSEGRAFPLTLRHLPYTTTVEQAAATLLAEGHRGDILAFLPGSAEIHSTLRACGSLPLLVLPLHGSLPPLEQDRVLAPSPRQKLILSTNVAESSVTVPGVTAVIDTGLHRQSTWSPWSGLPTLAVTRISQASATQRAGRAGRTAPGTVLRLYPQQDFDQRPPHDTPEILRADLTPLALTLRALNLPTPTGYPMLSQAQRSATWAQSPEAPHATNHPLLFLTPPLPAALLRAEALLDLLAPTPAVARQLARYPLPPRLARVVLAALDRGLGESGCQAAALLASPSRTPGDLLPQLDAAPDPAIAQALRQLLRLARPPRQTAYSDDALLQSLLTAFPDRVARRRAGREVTLSNGASAELAGEAPSYDFLLALDVEDRPDKPLPLIRTWCRTEPDWLLDLFPERLTETETLLWNRAAERAESVSTLRYDQLPLSESTNYRPDPERAADLLVHKALEAGLARFVDPDELANFEARLLLAGHPPLVWAPATADLESTTAHTATSEPLAPGPAKDGSALSESVKLAPADRTVLPEAGLSLQQSSPTAYDTLRQLATGLRSFAELTAVASQLLPLLEAATPRLREDAPTTLKLPAQPGKPPRTTRVHYEAGKPPWISSRLQDFFGMTDTPRLGPQRQPVVVHLLAPNGRAVQTTTDLAGFWQRLYPTVRKELSRRYPRHPWPERP